MRPRILTPWAASKKSLMEDFGLSKDVVDSYDKVSKEDQLKAYEMMQLCRQFETACNQVKVNFVFFVIFPESNTLC